MAAPCYMLRTKPEMKKSKLGALYLCFISAADLMPNYVRKKDFLQKFRVLINAVLGASDGGGMCSAKDAFCDGRSLEDRVRFDSDLYHSTRPEDDALRVRAFS